MRVNVFWLADQTTLIPKLTPGLCVIWHQIVIWVIRIEALDIIFRRQSSSLDFLNLLMIGPCEQALMDTDTRASSFLLIHLLIFIVII